jgi:hypothetical protein
LSQSRARRYEADKRADEAAAAAEAKPGFVPSATFETPPKLSKRAARDYKTQKANEAAAAAEEQRAAKKNRPPTTGAVEIVDPRTNMLRPLDINSPPVNELTSAAGKVERGERATMSATERLAWKRYNANLAAATDPTYASRFTPEDLSNRQWLMNTVDKARQKADAFDEIAKRADETQAGRNAAQAAEANRDRMLDFLDDLQTRLSALPKQKLGQGPKTRNALRDGRSNDN